MGYNKAFIRYIVCHPSHISNCLNMPTISGKPSTPIADARSPMSQVSISTDASDSDFFDAPDHFLVEEDGLITEVSGILCGIFFTGTRRI